MNWFVDSNGGNAVIMAVLLDEYPIPSILGFQSDERISAQMAWFAAPARPVVDFEDCRLEVFPMHFARDPWAVQIAQLRKSRPGSLFTIVFRVRDESILSGEVLALE